MSTPHRSGRLSTLQAAMIVARRDFSAILFSRSFFFFLLGPLFPVIVGLAAGSVGHKVEASTMHSALGVAMSAADTKAMIAANTLLAPRLGGAAPEMVAVRPLGSRGSTDPAGLLTQQQGNVAAIVSGTLAQPVLTGTPEQIDAWQAPVSLIAAQAAGKGPQTFPEVALAPIATSNAADRQGRMHTAQSAQMLLFLLTMLLAGMVLSNLVEDKANKIIEVLA
ncbi:MAG: ABC transporter permease, partial [Novosphingobium sp.]